MATPYKRRIGSFTGWAFILFCAGVDTTQIILDFFGIGLVANRIIDGIMAVLFLFLLPFVFKVSFAQESKLYFSLAATMTGEIIPLLDVAPLWSLDAWYVIHSIQKRDREGAAVTENEETREEIIARQIAERDYRIQVTAGLQKKNEEDEDLQEAA